jgi:hypothetical protein
MHKHIHLITVGKPTPVMVGNMEPLYSNFAFPVSGGPLEGVCCHKKMNLKITPR